MTTTKMGLMAQRVLVIVLIGHASAISMQKPLPVYFKHKPEAPSFSHNKPKEPPTSPKSSHEFFRNKPKDPALRSSGSSNLLQLKGLGTQQQLSNVVPTNTCQQWCEARYEQRACHNTGEWTACWCVGAWNHGGSYHGGCRFNGTLAECEQSCDQAGYNPYHTVKLHTGDEDTYTDACKWGCRHATNTTAVKVCEYIPGGVETVTKFVGEHIKEETWKIESDEGVEVCGVDDTRYYGLDTRVYDHVNHTCCLVPGVIYTLTCSDVYGDGWVDDDGNPYALEVNGVRYCDHGWTMSGLGYTQTVSFSIPTTTSTTTTTSSATTTTIADDGVTSFGDPHIKNLQGERFDISRQGSAPLLKIPADTAAHLEIEGEVQRQHQRICQYDMYFKQVRVNGDFLEKNITVKTGNREDGHSFLVLVDGQPHKNGDSSVSKAPSKGNHGIRIAIKNDIMIEVVQRLGRKFPISYLDIQVTGLKNIASRMSVGGLLGYTSADDHSNWTGKRQCQDKKPEPKDGFDFVQQLLGTEAVEAFEVLTLLSRGAASL